MVGISGSPKSVSLEVLFKIIEQMKKSICKINIENRCGTGFFCYIPYKNKKLPSLITNNHIIYESFIKNNTFINIELNNEPKKIKKINLKDKRIIYTNKEYDITIIEIIPQTDLIYNFLELDENIFYNYDNYYFIGKSIYLLQSDNKVSFGILKNIGEHRINHLCNSDQCSSGSPLINLSNGKIIGIHIGSEKNYKYNLGTFLKYPINDFINKFKDYIDSKTINSFINTNESDINDIKDETQINNLIKKINDLENELKQEKEKNKKLEEKISQMQILLNKNKSLLNKGNSAELLDTFLKKDKIIDDLKSKLDRFPFILSQGEKLMSIIFTNTRQSFYYSAICKNTDIFCNIEAQLYKEFPEYSETENYFTINGMRIKKTKTLDENKIKNNNIILLNVYEI